MKIMKERILAGIACLLFASTIQSFAVVDQAIQVDGTNLVLSWPSQGYENYLIQYRHKLDPSTPWTALTNNYPANSTNRTTYIIPCCTLADLGGGGNSFASGGESSASSATLAASDSGKSDDSNDTYWWAMPKDGSGDAVPLVLYPLGFDTSSLVLVEPPAPEAEAQSPSQLDVESDGSESNGPLGISNGGCDCPDMGFFRVFHIPDWTFNVTNYTYDGPTFFPVDFADYLDRVENIEVLLNGQPTSDVVFTYIVDQGQTNWGMGIYFDLFPSGTYQIQLRSTLRLNDEIGDGTVYLVLSNLTRNIVLDNQVTFTNWDGLILSSNFTFQAQTKTNNTDWWIDIYGASSGYVNGGSGHTTNGQIAWTWDLTDTLGTPRDDLDSDPFFDTYITFAATGTGQLTTRRNPAPQTEYPSTGYWLVSYSDKHYIDAGGNYSAGDQYYTNGITDMAGAVTYRNIPVSIFPINFGTNSYTQAQRNDSWAYLKANYLYNPLYRNFYYYGHGNANKIGADVHTFDANADVTGGMSLPGSKAFLTSQIVSNEFTFNRYAGERPYRFVWLDGCSSANGNWPGAFGINKATNDYSYYTNSVTNPKHRRPSAFAGWNQIIGGGDWGFAQDFWNFRTQFMQEWSYNWQTRTLVVAFGNGRQSSSWPPGGDPQLWGALRVYGYTVMKFNDYNQKNDWRWP